jgi:hypothetical protein
MCSLPNIQARDLEEFLQPRTKHTVKRETITMEIVDYDSTIMLQRV